MKYSPIVYDTDINGDGLFPDTNDCVMLLKIRDDIKIVDYADLLLFIISYGSMSSQTSGFHYKFYLRSQFPLRAARDHLVN